MAKQLFGTDGIRGFAGEYPLDPQTVFAFGCALGRDLASQQPSPMVVIGADTRESGPWIAELVAGGLATSGARVDYAGVITTPGVAYLTRIGPFRAGVMISASHNPFQDNGLKVFSHSGFKLPDAEEHLIEEEIFRVREHVSPEPVRLEADETLDRQYLEYLLSTISVSLAGANVVIDCGNGAASTLGPELFRALGADVRVMGCSPDGRNINLNSGALHVEGLQAAVLAARADFGVAFDGDADRAIFIAQSGKIVDGDGVLLLAGRALKNAGRLPGNLVVSTVMSNLGLEKALQREGIRMTRTPVGDKYVLEEMVRLDAALGGEQSGHVIFRERATTGDGLLTALHVAEICRKTGAGLDDLTADLRVYPQRLENIRVREKRKLSEVPPVAEVIRGVEAEFDGAGRVLVRYSGTEPLARVMVEGPDQQQVDLYTARIADVIRRELGA